MPDEAMVYRMFFCDTMNTTTGGMTMNRVPAAPAPARTMPPLRI